MKTSTFSFHNWKLPASQTLTAWTGAIGTLAVYKDEVLALLHEAPFPVADTVDHWVTWILKASATVLTILTIFTKKPENTPTDAVEG